MDVQTADPSYRRPALQTSTAGLSLEQSTATCLANPCGLNCAGLQSKVRFIVQETRACNRASILYAYEPVFVRRVQQQQSVQVSDQRRPCRCHYHELKIYLLIYQYRSCRGRNRLQDIIQTYKSRCAHKPGVRIKPGTNICGGCILPLRVEG